MISWHITMHCHFTVVARIRHLAACIENMKHLLMAWSFIVCKIIKNILIIITALPFTVGRISPFATLVQHRKYYNSYHRPFTVGRVRPTGQFAVGPFPKRSIGTIPHHIVRPGKQYSFWSNINILEYSIWLLFVETLMYLFI